MSRLRQTVQTLLASLRLNSQLPANVCFSGGAKGSDRAWGDAAAEAGHRVIHWLNKPPHAASTLPVDQRVVLPEALLLRADPHLALANEQLNRRWPTKNDYANGLLRRDVYQVLFSEQLYVISELDSAGIVAGGSAWATQAFLNIRPHGELWILDQSNGEWWGWRDSQWRSLARAQPPPPRGLWTGIGTTKLDSRAADLLPGLLRGTLPHQMRR